MQVSIQTTSDIERQATISVPAARVDDEVNSRLNKASGNVRIDGFRPGKVPFKVLQKRFGGSIRQEVLGDIVNETFTEAVRQEDLRPVGMPSIEPKQVEEGKDFEYVATFEVFPEIELKDYSGIEVERLTGEIVDADIDNMLETFRKQQATWEDAAREAKLEDQVNIDFEGSKDGELFEGGSGQGMDLVLGSGRMIPGFEDAIVGMKAGEEKVAPMTFPETYHVDELKSAAVEFKITVNAVQEQKLPELNDELFEVYGFTDGGEEGFRKEVRKNMEREMSRAAKAKVKAQVMDGLIDQHTDLPVPKLLVQQEIDVLRDQMTQQFGAAAQQIDVKSIFPDEMFTEQAERRVRLGLILNEYISKNEIKAEDDKVNTALEELSSTYEDPAEVIEFFRSQPQQMQQVQSMVVEDEVVEKILANAKLTDTTCSYEEVLKQSEQEAE